jgi:aconitase A
MIYGLHHKNKNKKNSGKSRIFQQKIILPFPSSHDLETQATADLTHTLLHPQPADPFCQVGDEQTIALKRLAGIFASAKPRNKNNQLAPQDEIENNAPKRVQTTVSPTRVAGTDQEQISLQHITPSQSIPNSHRRQQTLVRQIVTPQTPHVMWRHSARQQNLSQDVMAETINQANHCFSISSQTKYTQQQSTNADINFYGNSKCRHLLLNR